MKITEVLCDANEYYNTLKTPKKSDTFDFLFSFQSFCQKKTVKKSALNIIDQNAENNN